MTPDLVPAHLTDAVTLLQQTVEVLRSGQGTRPSPATVVSALLTLENAGRHRHQSTPFEPLQGQLQGQWRLVFTTGVRKQRQGGISLGQGFYLPRFAPAHIGFGTNEQGQGNAIISNQVQLGPFRLRFTGPYRSLNRKNLIAFDFTRVQVQVFDRPILHRSIRSGRDNTPDFQQQPIAKLPFFAFFWVTDQAISARGRGGGLALWIRD